MGKGKKQNPVLAQAFSAAIMEYVQRESLSVAALARNLRTSRQTAYSYLDRVKPSAPNGRNLRTAVVELGLEIKLPGHTITKDSFISAQTVAGVSTLNGKQLTLALQQSIQVREVFVNIDSKRTRGNEVVLRMTLAQ